MPRTRSFSLPRPSSSSSDIPAAFDAGGASVPYIAPALVSLSAPDPAAGRSVVSLQGEPRSPYLVRNDAARASSLASDYKNAIKAAVIIALPVSVAGRLTWGRSIYPCMDNPELIKDSDVAGLAGVSPQIRRFMFMDDATATCLEESDGVWPAIERVTSRYNPKRSDTGPDEPSLFSAPELLQLFDEQIMPAQLQPSSRANYWAGWKQVLTFGLAHGGMDKLLPMSNNLLRSLTAEFLMVGVAANSISNIWSAIVHLHRMARLPAPLA